MILFLLIQENCSNVCITSQKSSEIFLVKLSGQLFWFFCLKGPVVRKCLRIIRRGSAAPTCFLLNACHLLPGMSHDNPFKT